MRPRVYLREYYRKELQLPLSLHTVSLLYQCYDITSYHPAKEISKVIIFIMKNTIKRIKSFIIIYYLKPLKL